MRELPPDLSEWGVPGPFDAATYADVTECIRCEGVRRGFLFRRPEDRGLSGWVTVREEGREIVIARDNVQGESNAEPPMREEGDISGFSADSARRLRALFDRLRRDAKATFLTLTYHERDPGAEEAKEHLHAFVQDLRRRYDRIGVSLIWRMEWQESGTIHFHLLLFGLWWEKPGYFKRIWHRITGEDDAARRALYGPTSSPRWGRVELDGVQIRDVYPGAPHRGMGAWVEQMGDEVEEEKIRNYVAKYHCKQDSHAPPQSDWTGRHWGVRFRENLPIAPVTNVVRISYQLAYEAVEMILEKWGTDIECVPYSLRVSSDSPGRALNKILGMAGDRMIV